MNELVISSQLWVHFQIKTDVIISDLLSIRGILTSPDLIRGERRDYLYYLGSFCWDNFLHKKIQKTDYQLQ